MLQPTYLEYIADIQTKIHGCLSQFVRSTPFALVDFPDIKNVGDSAIWLGEIAYFSKQHSSSPRYVSGMWDFSEAMLDQKAPEGPILIQGGGTFGDVWGAHQDFRIRLLNRWPNRPIVQLPQSIHYESADRVKEMAVAISKHKNFTLLLRDQESVDFAEKHFDCRVLLCPDMAFGIGPIVAKTPVIPVLAMLRDDREKAVRDDAPLHDVPVEDWIFTERRRYVRIAKAVGVLSKLASFDPMKIRFGKYNAAAKQRLGRGVRQIERAQVIVTDRLHVHIVSLLLGRPHAVLDNSYGKITRFMSAFPGGMDLTYRATSLSDAVEWAKAKQSQISR